MVNNLINRLNQYLQSYNKMIELYEEYSDNADFNKRIQHTIENIIYDIDNIMAHGYECQITTHNKQLINMISVGSFFDYYNIIYYIDQNESFDTARTLDLRDIQNISFKEAEKLSKEIIIEEVLPVSEQKDAPYLYYKNEYFTISFDPITSVLTTERHGNQGKDDAFNLCDAIKQGIYGNIPLSSQDQINQVNIICGELKLNKQKAKV